MLEFYTCRWICVTGCDVAARGAAVMAVGVCSFEQNEVNAVATLGIYLFIMLGTQPQAHSLSLCSVGFLTLGESLRHVQMSFS